MRTTKVLHDGNLRYKSGETAYKGAVLALYKSSVNVTVDVELSISNAGDILCPIEDSLREAINGRIPHGRIGAMKKEYTEVLVTRERVQDKIVECNNLKDAVSASSGFTLSSDELSKLRSELNYTTKDGRTISFDEVWEEISAYSEHNRKIREEIDSLKKAFDYSDDQKRKMPEALFEQICQLTSKLKSTTGVSLVITVRAKHVINTSDNYVKCSDLKSAKVAEQKCSYNKVGTRLVGKEPVRKYFVPIQSVSQLKYLYKGISSFCTTRLAKFPSEEVVTVYSRSGKHPDGTIIDLDMCRKHDEELSNLKGNSRS